MGKEEVGLPAGKYAQHYSAESFWKKVGKVFKRVGRVLIEKALILWYVLESPDTPLTRIIRAAGRKLAELRL